MPLQPAAQELKVYHTTSEEPEGAEDALETPKSGQSTRPEIQNGPNPTIKGRASNFPDKDL